MIWPRLRTAAAQLARHCRQPPLPPLHARGIATPTSTPTYTSATTSESPSLVGPDQNLTSRSRKAQPYLVRSRNAAGPYVPVNSPVPSYPKRKSPFKRCKALLNVLDEEERLRMESKGRAVFAARIPRPQTGDIVRVGYVRTMADGEPTLYFTGIVMSVRRRGVGSMVILRNVVEGVAIERGFPMYSPLVRDAQVVGTRKVRVHKLYYLRRKPLRDSAFGPATAKPADAS